MIFTPEEVATLEVLHPNRDEYMEFFYLLSDRVQEEDEAAAEGMRFLVAIGAYPHVGKYGGDSWFCGEMDSDQGLVDNRDRSLEFCNFVPGCLDPNSDIFASLGECLEVTLNYWMDLTPNHRSQLWAEWGGAVCPT